MRNGLLVSLRRIFGNFPVGSSDLPVRHGKLPLGHVPAENALRIISGDRVRFGGRVWQVRRADADGFDLKPAARTNDARDFLYKTPSPGAEPFLCNRAWGVLTKGDLSRDDLHKSLADPLRDRCAAWRSVCGASSLPVVAAPNGFRYITFAGSLVNFAIGRYFELATGSRLTSDDVSIHSPRWLDWCDLPAEPEAYAAPEIAAAYAGEETLFQTLLPNELRLRESMEAWLRDETVPVVLRRLTGSTLTELSASVADAICPPPD